MSGPLGVVSPELGEHTEAVLPRGVEQHVRHAHATNVTITVSVDDELVIDVVDDGDGIPENVWLTGACAT